MRTQSILAVALGLGILSVISSAAYAQTSDGAILPTSAPVELKSNVQCADGTCDSAGNFKIGRLAGATAKGMQWPAGKHHGAMQRVHAIKSLPTLTAEQSQQIDSIVASFREQVKPLREQAKSLRDPANSEGAENAQAKLTELKTELKAKAKEAMQKLLAVLTPEQKQQLKQQRAGGASRTMPTPNALPPAPTQSAPAEFKS